MKRVAPVVLWVYAKPYTTMNTLLTLSENFLAKQTDLYIVSNMYRKDADEREKKKVQETRECVSFFEKELRERFNSITVIYRNAPLTIGENMTRTIKYIFEKYDYAVFLEDDISVSTNFLDFMNSALDYYKDDKEVFAVCGNNMISMQETYETDVFACDMFKSHGYALWKEKYDTFLSEFNAAATDAAMDKIIPSEFYEKYHVLFVPFALYVLGINDYYFLDLFFMLYCILFNKLSIFPFVSVSQSSFGENGVNYFEGSTNFKQFFNPTFKIFNTQRDFALERSKLSHRDYKKLYQINFNNDNSNRHQIRDSTYCVLMTRISDMMSFASAEILDDFFAHNGIKRIAIYGLGGLYREFYSIISNYSSVSVAYGIDKNAANLERDQFNFDLFSEYRPSLDVDAVLVTWHHDNEEIIDKLKSEGCNKPIIFAVPFMMDFLYESDKLNKRFKRMFLR